LAVVDRFWIGARRGLSGPTPQGIIRELGRKVQIESEPFWEPTELPKPACAADAASDLQYPH